MRIDVVTLFPEMFSSVLGHSILSRAARAVRDPAAPDDRSRDRAAVASYHLHDLRGFSEDPKHHKIDAPPYGGGPGMVIQCEPVWRAVQAATAEDTRPPHRVFLTPKGRPLTAAIAEELAGSPRLLLLCGHYEGVDERVLDRLREEPPGLDEISVGDFVLSGGELAAMVLIDAVVRLLPGALGHADSAREDSFAAGADRLLDHPHFSKPPIWAGREVPAVLRSGDHAAVDAWRRESALATTKERRPDLLGGLLNEASPGPGGAVGGQGHRVVAVREEPDESGGERLARIVAEASGVGVASLSLLEARLEGQSTRGLARLCDFRVDPPFESADLARPMIAAAIQSARACGIARLLVPCLWAPEALRQQLGMVPAADAGYASDTAFDLVDLRPGRSVPAGRVVA